MIGIDANVLIRYITQDDLKQSQVANHFIEKQISSENPGVISKIVLCELAWMLSKPYRYNREQITTVLRQILMTREFTVEETDTALQALEEYQHGKAGFADYLIAQTHVKIGAKYTATFDITAAKGNYFKLLQ